MGYEVNLPEHVMQKFLLIEKILDLMEGLDSASNVFKMMENQIAMYLEIIEKDMCELKEAE